MTSEELQDAIRQFVSEHPWKSFWAAWFAVWLIAMAIGWFLVPGFKQGALDWISGVMP